MKKYVIKGLSILLCLCLLLPLAGCEDKEVSIICENAAQGTRIGDLVVSVSYGDTAVEHTATWLKDKGGKLYAQKPDDQLGKGDYELHVSYSRKAAPAAPVAAYCNGGELTGTQQLDDGTNVAVIRFHFDKDPNQLDVTQKISITCETAAPGKALDQIPISVFYGQTPLDYTATWKIVQGEERFELAAGSTLEQEHYELHVRYHLDATEHIPVIAYCNDGEMILSKKLDDGSSLAIIRYYFIEADPNATEPTEPAPKPQPVIINCQGIAHNKAISQADISVKFKYTAMPFTAEWYGLEGNELHALDEKDTFLPGQYELHLTFTMPIPDPISITVNSGAARLFGVKKLENNQYCAIIRIYIA